MPTEVVNIRTDYYDVYIGRRGRGHDGDFGNPILLGNACAICGHVHYYRGETLNCYRTYLWQRIAEDSHFRLRVTRLSGKVLGCFCKPDVCHGDILATFADWLAAGGWETLSTVG